MDDEKQICEASPTLRGLLEEYREQLDYVILSYKWGPYVAVFDTDCYFMDDRGHPADLSRFVVYDRIDSSFSFCGPYGDAVQFSINRTCWDGLDVTIDGPLLIGEHVADIPTTCKASPEDLRGNDVNVRLQGLVYRHRGKYRFYDLDTHGPIYRRSDTCHYDGCECPRGNSCEACPVMKAYPLNMDIPQSGVGDFTPC